MANGNHKDITFRIDDADFKQFTKRVKGIADGKIRKREVLKILKRQMSDMERGVKSNTPVRGADSNNKFEFNKGENKGTSIVNQANKGFKGVTGTRSSMKTKKRIFPRGNLKKSIGLSNNNRLKDSIGVRLAPRKGRRKKTFDGFYGWWHVYGWHPFGSETKVPANDFIWKGAKPHMSAAEVGMTKKLEKYIKKQLKL